MIWIFDYYVFVSPRAHTFIGVGKLSSLPNIISRFATIQIGCLLRSIRIATHSNNHCITRKEHMSHLEIFRPIVFFRFKSSASLASSAESDKTGVCHTQNYISKTRWFGFGFSSFASVQ